MQLNQEREGKSTNFSGSYAPEDVQFLLKPAAIDPTPVEEKERLIQSGERHYSEMLSAEKVPDARYLDLYHQALTRNAGRLKGDIESLAKRISLRRETSCKCVIVSLARAGTPIGVLLARDLQRKGLATSHYSISIIRGRGIDTNALRYILARHDASQIVFVDGWTGKGAITQELVGSLKASGLGIDTFLAVVADPAGTAHLAATTEDYVIPSGLLNGIVSGLVSRSVLNDEIVANGDFHACLFMKEHAEHDISRRFIAAIEEAEVDLRTAARWTKSLAGKSRAACQMLLETIMASEGVDDVNRIKPGIAEATRALLRRVPDKVILADMADPEVAHMIHLAEQAGVPIEERPLGNYRAMTIIKKLGGAQE